MRKIRNRMPETYQLVFCPMGEIWNLDKDSEDLRNINSIKDNSALVNSAIADYTNDTNLVNLLREKAPLA